MKLSLLLFWLADALVATGADTLSPVTRDGSRLLVDGKEWKAVGPNIYWLGLDENVVPPAGEPFDPSTRASYPTKGRITDAMATVKALGGTIVRSHTLGVSVGNPLSVMPEPGVVNEDAFDAIDWAVYQAGRYGIRLMVPLTDNWVSLALPSSFLSLDVISLYFATFPFLPVVVPVASPSSVNPLNSLTLYILTHFRT